MTDDVDAWLLDQYEQQAEAGRDGSVGWLRPIFQLLPDVSRLSDEACPVMSGQAAWPEPFADADLDLIERQRRGAAVLAPGHLMRAAR